MRNNQDGVPMQPVKITWEEYTQELGKVPAMRAASFELIRLWRHGWDVPGTSGHQSYLMAHRRMTDLLPEHQGSMVKLAQAVLATLRPERTGE